VYTYEAETWNLRGREEGTVAMCKERCEEFLIQRTNTNEWLIGTKNKLYGLCKQIVDIRSRCVG